MGLRGWIARLGLVLAGALLPLLLLEIVLRVVDAPVEVFNPLHGFHVGDARLGWKGKPDVARRFRKLQFDAWVEHDASGFRRPDPPPSDSASEQVLVLGDSYAWGWGVSQGEVVTDRLQRAVAPKLAIHNRGVVGFGTGQEYLLLADELARRRYTEVIVLFCVNDLTDNIDQRDHRPLFALQDGRPVVTNLPLPERLQGRVADWIDEHSRAASFLSYQLALLKERRRGRAPDDESPAPVAPGAAVDPGTLPGREVTRALLVAMSDLGRAAGAELSVVYVPAPEDVRDDLGGTYVDAVRAMVEETCRTAGIPFLDLAPRFRARAAEGAALFIPRDGHWSAAGHALAAEVIQESVLRPRP